MCALCNRCAQTTGGERELKRYKKACVLADIAVAALLIIASVALRVRSHPAGGAPQAVSKAEEFARDARQTRGARESTSLRTPISGPSAKVRSRPEPKEGRKLQAYLEKK